MNLSRGILCLTVPGLLLVASLATQAQWDKKPYTEWSEKETTKLLNDSPWGKTQTFDSPMVNFRGPTSGRQGVSTATTNAPPDALHVFFRVRLLSAKPVRQAFSRMIELKQKGGVQGEQADQLKQFASGEILESIVIAVSSDAQDAGANVQQANALLRRDQAAFKNTVFLEVKGGKRIYMQEFKPMGPDGFGARFIFQRMVDGKPFITPESEEIHFVAPLDDTYRIDRRFKLKEMMFDGKLEY